MTEPTPWYRQFWPWFLIGIPLLGMILSTITAVTAMRGADQEVLGTHVPMSKTSWSPSSSAQGASSAQGDSSAQGASSAQGDEARSSE